MSWLVKGCPKVVFGLMSANSPLWSDCGPSRYEREPERVTDLRSCEHPNMWSIRLASEPMYVEGAGFV